MATIEVSTPVQVWPQLLWLARHGESAGNVARDLAESQGLGFIDIAERDMDVGLSDRGREQAAALGEWIAKLDPAEQPDVVLASPYVRAFTTAEIVLDTSGLRDHVQFCADERLREREFGVLDRLTRAGIIERFPDEAERRTRIGKFYHRPPGGESWCDVLLRVRSVVDTITRDHCQQRVLIVAHQVVILMFRYLLENLTEQQILEVDRQEELANCSVGSYEYNPDPRGQHMVRRLWNHVAPVVEAGAPVTTEPDVPAAPR